MEPSGVVGIDVSKAQLDVAFRPSGKRLAVPNAARAILRLVNMLKKAAPECVLLEATGGYEFRLVERLLEEGLPVVVVNARLESSRALQGGWQRPMPSTLAYSRIT